MLAVVDLGFMFPRHRRGDLERLRQEAARRTILRDRATDPELRDRLTREIEALEQTADQIDSIQL